MIDTGKEHLKSNFKQSVDPGATCDEREPRSTLSACIRQSYPTYATYPVFVGFFRRHPRISPRPSSYEMSQHDTLTLSLEKHDRFLNASQFVDNEIRSLTLRKLRWHFAYLIQNTQDALWLYIIASRV